MRRQKKVIRIEDALKKQFDEIKYSKSLSEARASKTEEETVNKLKVKTGNYSLRARIKNSAWLKSHPGNQARKWLFKEVFTNSRVYRYNKMLLFQGGLFTFEYKNPKYKGTSVLPWFDKYPLVLSLGPVTTQQGIRNIGFNLHLLPPKIRIIVICAVFELYKKMYRYQIFMKRESPVMLRYTQIVEKLEKYGVKFCVRMYIPRRMAQIVKFPYKDWHKAIFLPSRGYDSIRSRQLIKEWKMYNKRNGIYINPNIDWKSKI